MSSKITYLIVFLITTIFWASCTIDDNINTGDDKREIFLGEWNCTETDGTSYTFTFPVTIVEHSSDSNKILIQNFGFIGYGEKPPYGTIANSSVTIPTQLVCNDNSTTVSGYGILVDKNTMQWDYELLIGGDKMEYSATFNRK